MKKSIFQKRFTSLHLFSIYGVAVIVGSAIVMNIWINRISELNAQYEKALVGADLLHTNYSGDFTDYALIFIVFWAILYMCFTLGYMIWYRYVLQKQRVSVRQQGKKVIIDFADGRKKIPFIVQAELVMQNESAQHAVEQVSMRQIAFMNSDQTFVFDISTLPTGKYLVQRVDFYIKDPLFLFNTHFSKDEVQARVLIDHSEKVKGAFGVSVSFDPEAMEAEFMSDANESYFATREYRIGDPLKRVHWRNTAKTHKLMIRIPEERTIKSKDLQLVINMYVPMVKESDYSVAIGAYIDLVLALLSELLALPYKSITLYVNGGATQVIRDIHTFSQDKVKGIVLEALVLQSKTNIQSFIQLQQLSNPFVVTMSHDVPSAQTRDVCVFAQTALLNEPIKKQLLKIAYEQKTEQQFSTIMDVFRSVNVIAMMRRGALRRKLIKLSKQNESNMPKGWRFLN